MLEPQSTVLFALLVVMFGALMWRIVVGRRIVLRVLAAGLAFVTAMLFGVLGVNRYYGYYQTWGRDADRPRGPERRGGHPAARDQARRRHAGRHAGRQPRPALSWPSSRGTWCG